MALLKKCGKTAVLMKKFIRGYIVNRLQQCLNQEVFYLLEHGYCDAEAIDLACKASFIPVPAYWACASAWTLAA